MQQFIDMIAPNKQPHRIIIAIILTLSLSANWYVFAEQQEIKKTKADQQTIAEMLKQTQAMINIQKASQEQYQTQLFQLQSDGVNRDLGIQTDLNELRMDQQALQLEQLNTNRQVLEQLTQLSQSIQQLAAKVDNDN